MTVEHVAVIALAVEVTVMVLARVGTERRHWNHHKRRGPAPLTRDDVTLVSGVLYALAAGAMAVGAVTARVEWTLSAIGTFALFGVLLPAFAANAVLVLATRGRPDEVTWWQRGIAGAVAVGGGLVSVGLVG
ncbi:hypothetical protein MTQ10_29830 [Streptomyces sp. XM83C]|jgi:hypothetical protein|uniref:hypothetical protein n=1 Tax=unclassified Streptomyces TaxID=2593676 RepID=UPI001FF984AD|nr:hypothetical protein [Streptomyces sp. XM83C]MCK1823670.1 hypothetical protein [Streptomyces sp. XM83C]